MSSKVDDSTPRAGALKALPPSPALEAQDSALEERSAPRRDLGKTPPRLQVLEGGRAETAGPRALASLELESGELANPLRCREFAILETLPSQAVGAGSSPRAAAPDLAPDEEADMLPKYRSDYAPPGAPLDTSQHPTIETKAVRLDPEIDPRRAVTQELPRVRAAAAPGYALPAVAERRARSVAERRMLLACLFGVMAIVLLALIYFSPKPPSSPSPAPAQKPPHSAALERAAAELPLEAELSPHAASSSARGSDIETPLHAGSPPLVASENAAAGVGAPPRPARVEPPRARRAPLLEGQRALTHPSNSAGSQPPVTAPPRPASSDAWSRSRPF
jgi:hypothetical protein